MPLLAAAALLGRSSTASGGELVSSGHGAGTAVGDQSVLHVGGDGDEGFLDVEVLLRGRLIVVNVVLLGQRLALLVGDCPLVLAIALVADKDLIYVHVSVLRREIE